MRTIPRLSIILISWNSRAMLERCLCSLRSVIERDDVEVIWVDNGSDDGTASMVEELFPQVRRRILSRNYGVAYARNRGIEMALGEYILILDDDTEATPEAIDELMAYMDTHPRTGIAGCALRDSDGHLQDSFKSYPGLGAKISNVLRSKLGKPRTVELPDGVIHPVYIIGACQIIRRAVFDKIGLLDEKIFYGPEDADFCMRAKEAGWEISYIPGVSILHHWRRITSRSLTSAASRRHVRALLYFWLKHRRL